LTSEWCRRGESNPRPQPYQGCALPLSYGGLFPRKRPYSQRRGGGQALFPIRCEKFEIRGRRRAPGRWTRRRVNGVGALRRDAGRALIRVMDKPVIPATEAAAVPEVIPSAPVESPVKAAAEVTTPSGPAVEAERAKAEKALRLAKALRDNLRRRKVATKVARPSN
jgi:hypothetical protein